MSWLGESVLVTGGAGFIGSHLVEELVGAGASVTVLDNRPVTRFEVGPDIALSDIRGDSRWSFVDLGGFDVIFHLAANAYVPPSVEDPLSDYATNCTATLNLLEALRVQRWPGRLVYASSAAVYGNPMCSPVREAYPTVPVSPYGVGKLAAERYCSVYAQLYGLNIASLRIFSVYGPWQRKQVVYDLMCKIAAGGPLHIHGDGTQVRDFTYVTDVVRAAMAVAACGDMAGEAYNVASGSETTIHELAIGLCSFMGAAPEFNYTGVNRPGDPERLAVDISYLRTLGYEPQVKFADGLAATVDWFQSVGSR